jgi:hypothetical protein
VRPADEGNTVSIRSGAWITALCHFAKFLDLTLDVLAFLSARSASTLLEGGDDAQHSMKRDGDKELVFGKAR